MKICLKCLFEILLSKGEILYIRYREEYLKNNIICENNAIYSRSHSKIIGYDCLQTALFEVSD